MNKLFDRRTNFDERSKNYPIRERLVGLDPKTQIWDCAQVLDQGAEGACVGFGCTHKLISTPIPILGLDNKFAREQIYWEAQKIDPWAGGSYPNAQPVYEGTDVLSGLKILKQKGYCNEYRWSFTHLDTQLGIAYEGAGIAGTDWMTGMMTPDSEGYIHATGYKEGGHCYLFIGIDVEKQAFIIQNSWGKDWGNNGQAFLSFDDYEKLRIADGEMSFLIGKKIPIPNPEEPQSKCFLAQTYVNFGNIIAGITGSNIRVKYRKEN